MTIAQSSANRPLSPAADFLYLRLLHPIFYGRSHLELIQQDIASAKNIENAGNVSTARS